MVCYECDRCKKEFTDKTKYSLHIQRKNPCKIKSDLKTRFDHSEESNDQKEIYHDTVEKEENIPKETEDLSFSNYCRLCKSDYHMSGKSYIEHLIEKHEIKKTEKIFRFSKKTSGTGIYQDIKESGDIVIIGFKHGKGLLFITSNLHNLQRHKKEKYRDMDKWIYFPCKNIDIFKMKWEALIKLNSDEMYPLDYLENESIKLLKEINREEKVEKTDCIYREGFYYQCPFCEESDDDLQKITFHFIKNHRFLKYDSPHFELNREQENHLLSIIDDDEFVFRNADNDYHSTFRRGSKNDMIISSEDTYKTDQYHCKYCQMSFLSMFLLQKHMKEVCRKSAFHVGDFEELIETNEKLRLENVILKEALISNQEILKDQNDILKNSMSYVKTTNIIQNNNILFNVNDFGNEDLSHIEEGFVEEVIQQMNTNSLVKFIEEVHYGNPRNCNVIIPPNQKDQQNTKLLLKKGDRWVMDDRKNVLDEMITINIERITDVYDEINVNLTEEVQSNFVNYVSGADTGMIRDEVISETESLIKRRQPSSKFLLENARVQQNQFIDGHWNKSIDTQLPIIKMDVGGMTESQIQHVLEGPPMRIMEKETPPILQKMQSMRNKKR